MEETLDLHQHPEAAEEMAANCVLKYLHECKLEGEDRKRGWIQRVFQRVLVKEFTY